VALRISRGPPRGFPRVRVWYFCNMLPSRRDQPFLALPPVLFLREVVPLFIESPTACYFPHASRNSLDHTSHPHKRFASKVSWYAYSCPPDRGWPVADFRRIGRVGQPAAPPAKELCVVQWSVRQYIRTAAAQARDGIRLRRFWHCPGLPWRSWVRFLG
jgi:hypothetical protein